MEPRAKISEKIVFGINQINHGDACYCDTHEDENRPGSWPSGFFSIFSEFWCQLCVADYFNVTTSALQQDWELVQTPLSSKDGENKGQWFYLWKLKPIEIPFHKLSAAAQEKFLIEQEESKPKKEYWYYLVWTLAPSHTIDEVKANINLLANRSLGIFYLDVSLEHGDINGREHYNMRIKSYRPIKKQRFSHYERVGKINYQTIRKHTEENWMAVGNYCSKENEIQVLIDEGQLQNFDL